MPRLPRRWLPRGWRVAVLVVLVGAAGALATLRMASPVQGTVGPGTVEVGVGPALDGATELSLPPLGRVVASTHRAPVALRVRLDELDVERLQRTLSAPRARQAITRSVEDDLPGLLRRFVLRSLLVAAVAGGVAGALVRDRRLPHAVLGAAGGAGAVGLALLWTWHGYDTDAFDEARFEGALERAPAILAAAQRSVGDLDRVSGLVQTLSLQVSGLYAATSRGVATGETLILHVSDLHSNPLGVELVEQLADSFDVDAVLDTGDLTSYGSPLESRIGRLIDDIDVPYLFVPGNHDSDENRAAFAATTGITVLDGTTTQVDGVEILGVGDPTFTADNVVSTRDANERKADLSPGVVATVRRDRPDLLAVHDLRQAEGVAGWVPVVVAGHTHERSSSREDGTTFLTVGSTGATGLGSFMVDTRAAYEAEVLRFDGSRLVAVDYVTLRGVSGEFTVERQVVDRPEPPARDGTARVEDDDGDDDGSRRSRDGGPGEEGAAPGA
jgi:predicted phosphodiesterase